MVATSPRIADVAAILTDYFNQHSVVPVTDPWSRIADGFLIAVHVYRWRGTVSLDAESWGFDPQDFQDLDVEFGRLNLIPAAIRDPLNSIGVQARNIPLDWGVDIPWVKVLGRGTYVPASRADAEGRTPVDRFKAEFAALEAKWHELIDSWVSGYEEARGYAMRQLERMAEYAWLRANAQGLNSRETTPYERRDRSRYVDYVVARHMANYPSPDEIRQRNRIDYTVSFIPKPSLALEEAKEAERVIAAKAAALEAQRREIERRQIADATERARLLDRLTVAEAAVARKRELVAEATKKFASDLDRRTKQAAREFEQAYALELRQRLHESLSLAIEGVRKGKLTSQAGISLRTTLDSLRSMLADGDIELEQMIARLDTLTAERSGKTFTAAKVGQQIEDLGVVLQTSILALGDAPRVPRRMADAPPMQVLDELPDDVGLYRERLAAARGRLALTDSIGERAIDAGMTPRRMRRSLAGEGVAG